MKSAEQIEHKGTIAFIERDFVRVKITVSEACGGCSARKSCAMGSREQREITIHTTEGYNYKVGDVVEISARQSIGTMAVVLCYVVPLVVLIITLIVANIFGLNDGISAVIAIGATALYYAILALFNKRISKKVTFQITKR